MGHEAGEAHAAVHNAAGGCAGGQGVNNDRQYSRDENALSNASFVRKPSTVPVSRIQNDGHEDVIGSPSNTAASMTGIERAPVLQRGRPLVAPLTRGRMSAERRIL